MSENKIKKAIIREDLLSITKDYRKAILLNQFIYWSERVSDADKFIEKENEIAKNNGEVERELFYGWIYKTAEELADEVMLGLSASQIRRYINDLVELGYISKRNNPKYKWDRTLQYRVNLVNIAKDLKKNGFPLSDYKIDIPDDENTNVHPCTINNEPEENQSQSGECAIPEITPENTNRDYSPEITDYSYEDDELPFKIDDNSEPSGSVFYNSHNSESKDSDLHNSHSYERGRRISMSLGSRRKQDNSASLKDMPARAKEMAKEIVCEGEEVFVEGVGQCVEYVVGKYREKNQTEHPHLKNETLRKVVETMLSSITILQDGDLENPFNQVFYPLVSYETSWRDRKKVIDKYFDTDFREDCDYSLVHFTQGNIITYVMQKCHIGEDMEWFYNEPIDLTGERYE